MSELEHIGSIAQRVLPIRIVIPGRPASYQRKTSTWHSKDGRSGINAYASKSYADWKSYARGRAAEICGANVAFPNPEQAVIVTINLYFEIPKSASKRFRLAALNRLIIPTKKPDCDNTAKAVVDSCLRGIVIRDDQQVAQEHILKWYSDSPRVEIEVVPWVPPQEPTLFNNHDR